MTNRTDRDWIDIVTTICAVGALILTVSFRGCDQLTLKPKIDIKAKHLKICDPQLYPEIENAITESWPDLNNLERKSPDDSTFIRKTMSRCYIFHDVRFTISNKRNYPVTLHGFKTELEDYITPTNGISLLPQYAAVIVDDFSSLRIPITLSIDANETKIYNLLIGVRSYFEGDAIHWAHKKSIDRLMAIAKDCSSTNKYDATGTIVYLGGTSQHDANRGDWRSTNGVPYVFYGTQKEIYSTCKLPKVTFSFLDNLGRKHSSKPISFPTKQN